MFSITVVPLYNPINKGSYFFTFLSTLTEF